MNGLLSEEKHYGVSLPTMVARKYVLYIHQPCNMTGVNNSLFNRLESSLNSRFGQQYGPKHRHEKIMKAAERLRTERKNENWRVSGEQDLLQLEVWHVYIIEVSRK